MNRFTSLILAAGIFAFVSGRAHAQYRLNPQAELLQLQAQQAAYRQALYQQAAYRQALYQQAAAQQALYQQALYQQALYQQALYQQALYQQAAAQQALYQQAPAGDGSASQRAIQGGSYHATVVVSSDSQSGLSQEEINKKEDEYFVKIRTDLLRERQRKADMEHDADSVVKPKELNTVPIATSVKTPSATNPPPPYVEGQVYTKTDDSDLMELSIGSEDGLVNGSTLDVFRRDPTKYLGTVRVMYMYPHSAVARPLDLLGPVQNGDHVASKISKIDGR